MYSRNYTPANACYYSGWNMFMKLSEYKTSQYFDLITAILQRGWNNTPAKRGEILWQCVCARTHARRRRRVGHREPTRGEDNVWHVLTRHIFGCCRFSVYPGRRLYWNMNTVGIQKNSQFSTLIITILLHGRNYTPAKNACYYSGWNIFRPMIVTNP